MAPDFNRSSDTDMMLNPPWFVSTTASWADQLRPPSTDSREARNADA